MEKPGNEVPLKSELGYYYPESWECLDGPHPRIKRIIRCPEKLLRFCRRNKDEDAEKVPAEALTDVEREKMLTLRLAAEAVRLKKEFTELEDFGVRVPRRDFLIGKNEAGEKAILTVIDRVRGKNLEKADAAENGKKLSAKGEELCLSLINYLTSKTRDRQPYLWDVFHYKQYVYGQTEKDEENHIYMVDVEPLYWEYNNVTCDYACVNISLWHLTALVNLLELKTGQKLKKIKEWLP
ncbi:hypothetical protein A2303_03155 [Candidatus Falkowbacteria bacterium RIFOXYB2_FULL_47_14]|uniref:Uncharacterized protein n=1 Tax=Candidatus Falkowbacteria bacterium RIFOXYA2_FULL_47_19 TaxID=1797994 RepID=A0A1F5SEY7_9BACT|nr:MAG: hypothetical protein A2227_07820 [Candidatus Falkowbacteria bacterium RIFOXYA2_FULL_47_19]OGF35185.1 MAG: hypothetical protein A2468_01990 [Candidatus Falkowbacteria bacterium RIFOXYC2_FULL_46_15]OGF43350.1 MAG: hypothetical protein A2303_03155 [Candidatus Falkowbacteria bacterium RIFOXYB2_FULL_47_14]